MSTIIGHGILSIKIPAVCNIELITVITSAHFYSRLITASVDLWYCLAIRVIGSSSQRCYLVALSEWCPTPPLPQLTPSPPPPHTLITASVDLWYYCLAIRVIGSSSQRWYLVALSEWCPTPPLPQLTPSPPPLPPPPPHAPHPHHCQCWSVILLGNQSDREQ